MAAPTKPTPVLENYHGLKQATVRLGLSDPDDDNDKRGQKWLRDGVNQEHDPFPCHRLAGQLKFSDSDLAEIAERNRNKVDGRRGPRKPRTSLRAAA